MKGLSILLLLSLIHPEWDGVKEVRSDSQWLSLLGPQRYRTLRRKETDPAFLGEYVHPRPQSGYYQCAACELPLFQSSDQYETGGAYPSFRKALSPKQVYFEEDHRLPFKRYEVLCRKCDSHLGHLFHDGPPPKYFRFCINSTALVFIQENNY